MARPMGQLERSLAALTIGVHQGTQQRRKALADTYAGDYEQQVHVPLSGTAALAWSFSDHDVQWEMPFLYAPVQHRVTFPTPHFNPGIELTGPRGDLVVIHAHVLGWTVTESQWFVGATIRFAVSAPAVLSTATVPFSAVAHLSFRGYAAMAETDEFAT